MIPRIFGVSKTSQVRKTKLKILRDDTSRMMGDYHVRFCERLAGETPACLLGLVLSELLSSFINSPTSAFTFFPIKSLTSLNCSLSIFFGSGICQSINFFARIQGHASPQPIVTTASKGA